MLHCIEIIWKCGIAGRGCFQGAFGRDGFAVEIKHYEGIEECEINEVHRDLLDKVLKDLPDEDKLMDLAELFKIFGDTTRIRILFLLLEANICVCDMAEALNMTPSAISHQLSILKRNKLIKSRREGKSIIYSLADDHVRDIIAEGMEHISE